MGKKKCYACSMELDKSMFHRCASKKDGLQSKCKSCANKIKKEWREKNPERVRDYNSKWQKENPDLVAAKSKRWYSKNKQKLAEKAKHKLRTDPAYNLANRLRCRLRGILRDRAFPRSGTTERLVGCSYDELVSHIEKQFTDGMSWENMSEWHIDHVVPLASAKNQEEMENLFHYSNLQPLWAYDNKSKGAKLITKGEI